VSDSLRGRIYLVNSPPIVKTEPTTQYSTCDNTSGPPEPPEPPEPPADLPAQPGTDRARDKHFRLSILDSNDESTDKTTSLDERMLHINKSPTSRQ
jgi:hypothetical protein